METSICAIFSLMYESSYGKTLKIFQVALGCMVGAKGEKWVQLDFEIRNFK